jgi:hypothetical protein
MFPVTQAYNKAGEVVTDRNAQEFKDAISNFNSMITHILHAFQPTEVIKKAMSVKISSFKDFCRVAMGVLPKDYQTKKLDIFLQYQNQPSPGKDKTYLELPKKMVYGKWVVPHIPGNWEEKRHPNPDKNVGEALAYIDKDTGAKHPFVRNGWFMSSNFAIRQGDTAEGGYTGEQADATATSEPATDAATGSQPSSW